MMYTLCNLVYKMYCKESQGAEKILKFTIITTILCLIAAIISACIDLFDIVYYFVTGIDVFHLPNLYLLIIFANLFYYIECMALYSVLFGRLYITFNNDKAIQQYRLSTMTIGYIISLIIIAALIMTTYCTLLIVLDEFSPTFYHILSVGISIICIIDITLNLSILSLFTYKLQQIIIYTYEIVSTSSVSSENIELNKTQEKILNVITKHTFLSIIAIICNQLFYGSVIGCGYIKDFDAMDACYLICSNGIRIFEGTINCAILYLIFSMNQYYYNKSCSICHDGCLKFCATRTKKKIVKRSTIRNQYQLL